MPHYLDKPTPDYVVRFSERMKEQWEGGGQKSVDDAMLTYMLLDNKVRFTKGKNAEQTEGFRSGIGGFNVMQDAALLTAPLQVRVNVPSDERKDKRKADDLLEPWLQAAVAHSQSAGQVWPRLPLDLRGLGRAWSNIYPHPDTWDNEEYNELLEKYLKATAQDEIKDIEGAMRLHRRDRWAILWRYVDARRTWSTFDGTTWLPEVCEIREMKLRDIVNEYGEKAVPKTLSNADSHTTAEVVAYANHNWQGVLVRDGEDGVFARDPFHHSMGQSPYGLAEGPYMPTNDNGWRWMPALFYSQYFIDTFDEALSNVRQAIDEQARLPLVREHDKEAYEDDEVVAGRPPETKLTRGSVVDLWNTEKLYTVPTTAVNPDTWRFLSEIKDLIQANMYRPVEQGAALSGQSNTLFSSAVQISERRFHPSMEGLAFHGQHILKGIVRCLSAPGLKDTDIEVFVNTDKKKGFISTKASDWKGWENTIQVRLPRAIEIDEGVKWNTVLKMLEAGLSHESGWTWAGVENPAQEQRRSDLERLHAAGFGEVVKAYIARAGQKLALPDSDQLLQAQELATQAPEDLLEFLSTSAPGIIPGNLRQGFSNEGRTGVPISPQERTEAVIPNGTTI